MAYFSRENTHICIHRFSEWTVKWADRHVIGIEVSMAHYHNYTCRWNACMHSYGCFTRRQAQRFCFSSFDKVSQQEFRSKLLFHRSSVHPHVSVGMNSAPTTVKMLKDLECWRGRETKSSLQLQEGEPPYSPQLRSSDSSYTLLQEKPSAVWQFRHFGKHLSY